MTAVILMPANASLRTRVHVIIGASGTATVVVGAVVSAVVGVTVPAAALRREQGRDYVLVVTDGRLERRAVAARAGPGDSVTVSSGLAPGESVVVEGPGDLADGMAVKEK